MTSVVCYGGYYSTGGSIVRDMFREVSPSFTFPTEFRLLKERYGLFDLEDTLLGSYAPENIDLAMKDFYWLTKNFARLSGRFRKAGMSYDYFTDGAFTSATKKFLSSLADYEYPMSWHFNDFKKSYTSQIWARVENKIFTRDIRTKEGSELATIAYPGREKFLDLAKDYLSEIVEGIQRYNGQSEGSLVGLHNAIPPFSAELIDKGTKYFSDCKVIITDRDPRDVFMNYPKDSYGRYIPRTTDILAKARAFVHFYKSIRVDQVRVASHPKVMFLKFEDVCLNYRENKKNIFSFAGVEEINHTMAGTVFSPEISRANIGMWRNAKGDVARAISYIEDSLSQYLYHG